MRKLLLLLPLLLIAGPAFAQGWQAVNLPTTDNLTGIDFVSPTTGFASTAGGEVARTTDGGRTWSMRRVADDTQLEDVSFADPKLGVACGKAGALFRTTDGGETWTGVSPVRGDTTQHFFSVELFDNLTGLAIGLDRSSANQFGSMGYRTADGGKTWKKLDAMGMGYSEVFYSPEAGVAFPTIGQLLRSSDKGKTWRRLQAISDGIARDLDIVGEVVLVAGPGGFIGVSRDGGKSWNRVKQAQDRTFFSVALAAPNIGFVAGANSVMLATTDGGLNWSEELLSKSFSVLDMTVVGKRVYAVGSGGAMIYKDLK